MKSSRNKVLTAAACSLICILLAAVGCNNKKPTDSSSGGGSGTVAVNGTWGVVSVQTVVNDSVTASTTVNPDSSDRYLVIEGASVLMYQLNTSGWYDQVDLLSGTYAGSLITTSAETLSVFLSGSQLLTAPSGASGTVTRYVYQHYTGDVPPDHWPTSYGTVNDDAYEPDDSRDEANELTAGTQAQLHTLGSADVDYFMVTLESGTRYLVQFSDSVENFSFSYYDAAGNRIYSYYGNDSLHINTEGTELGITVSRPMTLYVRVGGYSGGAFYTVSLGTVSDDLYEDDDTVSTATPVADGTVQQHRIFPGDADWFKLNLSTGTMYTLKMTVFTYGPGIEFFTADGEPLAGDGPVQVDRSSMYGYIITVTSGVTVYARVTSRYFSEYTVQLDAVVLAALPFSGVYYVSGINRSYQDADTSYTTNRAYSSTDAVSIVVFGSNGAEIHSYQNYEYETGHVTIAPLGGNSYLWAGQTVTITQTGGGLQYVYQYQEDGASVVHTVMLTSFGGQVPPAAWLTGPQIPSSAVSLVYDVETAGTIPSGGKVWYRFTALSGTTYVTYDADFDIVLVYMEPEAVYLVRMDDYDYVWTQEGAYHALTTVAGATYYIAVMAWDGMESGTYSLTVASAMPVSSYKRGSGNGIKDIASETGGARMIPGLPGGL